MGACFYTNPIPFLVLIVAALVIANLELITLLAGLDRGWPLGALRSVLRKLFLPLWVLVPLISLVKLHQASNTALQFDFHTPLLLAFIPLWAGDTAAIFAGKAFGKRLLAPSISPKKTWEGAIANFVACVLVAWGTAVWVGIGPAWGVLIGVITGVLGQVGDLFESGLKRQADVKDSGSLLPGHGGILDRIDSLLFTAIPTTIVYMIASSR